MALVTIIKKYRDPVNGEDKGSLGQEWINQSAETVFQCVDDKSRLWKEIELTDI